MQMSEMESQDMPPSMADMDMESNASPQPNLHDLLNSDFINVEQSENVSDEFFTQTIDPCPHCIMHSQSLANSPLRSVALNTPTYESTAVDSSDIVMMPLPAVLSFVEVHDHGPPGSSVPRYVLVAAFRI